MYILSQLVYDHSSKCVMSVNCMPGCSQRAEGTSSFG